jgi:hypothetical protein
MIPLFRLLRCDGRTSRITYQRNVALLALAKGFVDLMTLNVVPGTPPALVLEGWGMPFALIGPWMEGALPAAICASTLFFYAGLTWNSVHRCRDAGVDHRAGLLACVPLAGLAWAAVLAFLPSRRHSVWDLV